MINEKLEAAAETYQEKGCIEGLPMFENARTRWAKRDFEAGARWQAEQDKEKIEKLVKALEFYADYMNYSADYETSQNGFSRRCILYSDIEERNEATGLAGKKARQALEELRNGK